MPHECTNCGRTFPDGSKEMLSGCPNCGGNKFQFDPSGGGTSEPSVGAEGDPSGSGVTGTVSNATQTVRDWVGRGDSDDTEAGSTRNHPPDTRSTTERTDSSGDRTTSSDERTASSDASNRASSSEGSQSSPTGSGSTRTDLREETDATTEWPDHGFEDPYRDRDQVEESDDKEWPDVGKRPASESGNDDPRNTDPTQASGSSSSEDTAQASARSDVVSPDELPDPPENSAVDSTASSDDGAENRRADTFTDDPPTDAPPSAANGRVASTPDDDADGPDLEALRAELNEQFESIKIVRPGEYELNLMELYDREEYIVSLMEDGRYAIEVPDAWRGDN